MSWTTRMAEALGRIAEHNRTRAAEFGGLGMHARSNAHQQRADRAHLALEYLVRRSRR